jgi:hypothetical protein
MSATPEDDPDIEIEYLSHGQSAPDGEDHILIEGTQDGVYVTTVDHKGGVIRQGAFASEADAKEAAEQTALRRGIRAVYAKGLTPPRRKS